MFVCKGLKVRELISLILAPCMVLGVRTIQESIPMQTLQCYSNNTSVTTCTWMECSEAHQFVNVTLNCCEKNKEITCRSQNNENHTDCQNCTMHWVCHIHGNDSKICNFKFDRALQAELNFYLFHNVQTLPPQNLSASLIGSEAILLTWKAADESQVLGNALDYEVTYKRDWESWEKAASLLLSNTTHCNLSYKDLVPGSSYVARVRARPGRASGSSGQYSEWSTEVSWQTPEGGLDPRNLRCLFNGADRLTCSWEVKKAITTSVLFGLFFKATPASAEAECSPVHEKALPHIPYVLQSCEIPVSSPSSQSQYHVSVRAKTEEKIFESYKNIKVLPPTNVSVILTENQEYELRWIKHTLGYNFIKQRYQFEYWKNNQYEQKNTFLLLWLKLGPAMGSLIRVAVISASLQYSSNANEEVLPTVVLPTVVLPVMLSALIIPLLIVTYCSYKCFLRKKKMWEEKIPNPSKSLLIQSYQVKAAGQWPASLVQNTCEKVEAINCLQVLDGTTKSPVEYHGAEAKAVQYSHATLTPQISCQTSGAPHKTSLSLSTLVCPLNQTADPSCLIARHPCKSAADASTSSQTCFAFNGPYLYSPMMSSQPDMHQALQVDPVQVRERSGSLQYVTLPKEDCPQAPQRQEQPGAGPAQPFLLPNQKEMTQHLNNGKEVSPTPPACGEGTNIGTQDTSPKALGCITAPQRCPLEYITTDSLLLPSASDSSPPPLVTAEELPCDAQEPQPPRSHHSCHEFSPEKTGVMVPAAGQAPTSSPELHHGDFRSHSEPTKISLHIF
ncbi:LOW QUALITY PROTEIN: cytokine receptor common subunit beta-like [Porphyrio hochstetteri]